MYKPIREITQFYRFSNTLTIFLAHIKRTQQNGYQGFIDNPARPQHFPKIGFREELKKYVVIPTAGGNGLDTAMYIYTAVLDTSYTCG